MLNCSCTDYLLYQTDTDTVVVILFLLKVIVLQNKPDLLRFYSQQTQVLFSLELYGVQNIMSVPN